MALNLQQKLSPNFTLLELLKSPTANRMGLREQFDPPPEVVANLKRLCLEVLEPLRRECGPLIINSGYRCPRLNEAVKGARNSQHLTGEAADIECVNYTNALLFKKAQELKLPFDQLIWEFGSRTNPDWVHISRSDRNRKELLWIPARLKP